MPQSENIKLIQQCYENFGKGNIPGLLDALSDNIVWTDPGKIEGLYNGVRNGKKDVGEFFAGLNDVLNVTGFDVKRFMEEGDIVAAFGSISGTARSTDKAFSSDWSMVWEVKNNKVTSHQLYLDTNNIAKSLNK